MKTLDEFKTFILRGNVVDLAIAVVLGVAFGAVVTALVKDIITPLIAAIGGQPDFSALTFTINNSKFLYGDFINAVVSFLIIAAVIFFLVIKPLNALFRRLKTERPVDATTQTCPHCLSEIPLAATTCAFCTRDVALTGGAPAPVVGD
ncbi:MAG TPA: large conductance mechanosensitive channel protein MscL [Thermomicrobiaceae bacterium]|nr:large conductance mechanosensitive channel protein MscL [Thermomicrobiaceae bacterium]